MCVNLINITFNAGCNAYYPWEALVIGMIGGLSYLSVHFAVLKLGLDDPLDAVAVHAGGGKCNLYWGQSYETFYTSEQCKINKCCIFRPAFGCCAFQMLVEIVIFRAFCAKKFFAKF